MRVQKKIEAVAKKIQDEFVSVFADSGVGFDPDASSSCSSSDDEMPLAPAAPAAEAASVAAAPVDEVSLSGPDI